jgi:hypothetical protein
MSWEVKSHSAAQIIARVFLSRRFRAFRSSPFWDITQSRLVVTDVSGQPIGPILKNQAVQEESLFISQQSTADPSSESAEPKFLIPSLTN